MRPVREGALPPPIGKSCGATVVTRKPCRAVLPANDDDALGPARGILTGTLAGALLWALFILALFPRW